MPDLVGAPTTEAYLSLWERKVKALGAQPERRGAKTSSQSVLVTFVAEKCQTIFQTAFEACVGLLLGSSWVLWNQGNALNDSQ